MLCFEHRDPEGRLVRLTHGTWIDILAKQNRALLSQHLGAIAGAVRAPSLIQRDSVSDKHLLYYREASGFRSKLWCVAVKCLPRRFQGGWVQRRYSLAGLLLRTNWGEAWVASAYLVQAPKPRGERIWP